MPKSDEMAHLTKWQLEMRAKAQELTPGAAPTPWLNYQMAPAAGIFAGGWTFNNLFVMLSTDGYSIHDPRKGVQLILDQDADTMFDNISDDDLTFRIPATGESIYLFGIRAGDGVHVIRDWKVEIIYPWWPEATVVIYQNSRRHWDTVYALRLEVCDTGNWLKCGFSPNGETLAVVGHAGADFFSRDTG